MILKIQFIYLIIILSLSLSTTTSFGQEAKLLADDGAATDFFGNSVDVTADGNFLIIGADGKDGLGNNSGAAYIFIKSGGVWQEQAKLVALDESVNDQFGWRVAISDNGEYAIIGAKGENGVGPSSGAVYIFNRTGSTWTQQQKLVPSDPGSGDEFGYSVGINNDGTVVLVGAVFEDENGSNSGAAYIFSRIGSNWTQQAKLLADDGQTNDEFGYSCSINAAGDLAIIGAWSDDDNGAESGAAYIFTANGGSWSQQAKLTPNDGAEGDQFGVSSAIGTNIAVVGAWLDDDMGGNSGSVYVFTFSLGAWSQSHKITASDGQAGDYFGWDVDLNSVGNKIGVGAWGEDTNGGDSGTAYVFSESNWSQETQYFASDGDNNDEFGRSIAIDNLCNSVAVGAVQDSDNGSNSGSVYVFGDAAALPVELIYFEAFRDNEHVVLQWQTASELNNAGFYLEHSIDLQSWDSITFIKGHINSNQIMNYLYEHHTPYGGSNYYRLKQVDLDGQFTYSGIRQVKFDRIRYITIGDIYPNPLSNSSLNIPIFSDKQSNWEISILSTQGKVILTTELPVDKGQSNITLPVANLGTGVYYVVIGNDSELLRLCKLVINK